VALNVIQWATVKKHPSDSDVWRFADPAFRADYPQILADVRRAGFDAVMLEVLATQTLQDYQRMVADAGLHLAPGYCAIGLPEDAGRTLAPGSADHVRWFDRVRRKAEESNYFGLDTVVLAPDIPWTGPRASAAAVGAAFDADRLDRVIEVLAEATAILRAEGVTPGLHNHVGTWVETEAEIDAVLSAIPELRASFDIGHLAWAGIDPVAMVARYADRLGDLHVKDLDLTIAAESRATPRSYRETTAQRFFLEPGEGDLDLDGLLAALPDGFAGWAIIEVDRCSMPPFESAVASRAWVRARLGG
jgi:inosose dehydratase